MSKKRPVAGSPEPAAQRGDAVTVGAGIPTTGAAQRATSFVVEVVTDEEGAVRRTSVLHVADNEQESWPEWAPDGIVDFVARRFGAGRPPRAAAPPGERAAAPPAGGPHLEAIEAASADSSGGPPFLVAGGAFEVQATLEAEAPQAPQSIEYQAVVHAKALGARERQWVGELHGRVSGGERARLRIPAIAPPRGLYRLEMDVSLGEGSYGTAAIQGGLLQVS
jgi:hypothetical protein